MSPQESSDWKVHGSSEGDDDDNDDYTTNATTIATMSTKNNNNNNNNDYILECYHSNRMKNVLNDICSELTITRTTLNEGMVEDSTVVLNDTRNTITTVDHWNNENENGTESSHRDERQSFDGSNRALEDDTTTGGGGGVGDDEHFLFQSTNTFASLSKVEELLLRSTNPTSIPSNLSTTQASMFSFKQHWNKQLDPTTSLSCRNNVFFPNHAHMNDYNFHSIGSSFHSIGTSFLSRTTTTAPPMLQDDNNHNIDDRPSNSSQQLSLQQQLERQGVIDELQNDSHRLPHTETPSNSSGHGRAVQTKERAPQHSQDEIESVIHVDNAKDTSNSKDITTNWRSILSNGKDSSNSTSDSITKSAWPVSATSDIQNDANVFSSIEWAPRMFIDSNNTCGNNSNNDDDYTTTAGLPCGFDPSEIFKSEAFHNNNKSKTNNNSNLLHFQTTVPGPTISTSATTQLSSSIFSAPGMSSSSSMYLPTSSSSIPTSPTSLLKTRMMAMISNAYNGTSTQSSVKSNGGGGVGRGRFDFSAMFESQLPPRSTMHGPTPSSLPLPSGQAIHNPQKHQQKQQQQHQQHHRTLPTPSTTTTMTYNNPSQSTVPMADTNVHFSLVPMELSDPDFSNSISHSSSDLLNSLILTNPNPIYSLSNVSNYMVEKQQQQHLELNKSDYAHISINNDTSAVVNNHNSFYEMDGSANKNHNNTDNSDKELAVQDRNLLTSVTTCSHEVDAALALKQLFNSSSSTTPFSPPIATTSPPTHLTAAQQSTMQHNLMHLPPSTTGTAVGALLSTTITGTTLTKHSSINHIDTTTKTDDIVVPAATTDVPTITTTVANSSVTLPSTSVSKPKRKRKRPNYEPNHKHYVNPTNDDVLLGRGGRTNHHPGNHRYLEAKLRLQDRYLSASSKDEKTVISQELVDIVHDWGGRFLKLDDSIAETAVADKSTTTPSLHDQWYEVTNIAARKKASQTLRERNTPERRAMKRERYQYTSNSSSNKSIKETNRSFATSTSSTSTINSSKYTFQPSIV